MSLPPDLGPSAGWRPMLSDFNVSAFERLSI